MKKLGWYIFIAVALAGAVLLALLYFWAKRPVNSNVNISATRELPQATLTPSVPLNTDYFLTTLPAGFAAQSITEKDNGPQLLQISAMSSTKDQCQLALTIGRLPQEGLSGVADYNYRISNQNLYQNTDLEWLPEESVAFISTENFNEITLIWPHQTLYAIVSLSGPQSLPIAKQNLEHVISSWRWK